MLEAAVAAELTQQDSQHLHLKVEMVDKEKFQVLMDHQVVIMQVVDVGTLIDQVNLQELQGKVKEQILVVAEEQVLLVFQE